jgi:hypothetical protein
MMGVGFTWRDRRPPFGNEPSAAVARTKLRGEMVGSVKGRA